MDTDELKKIYEQHPYPEESGSLQSARWRLAAMEWIDTVWNPQRDPERILVAGCGTGTEAFALCKEFPHAEIIAVDFSPRSIAIAQHHQRRLRSARNIHFLVADLTNSNLRRSTGGDFDFITCHGVLSYIHDPRIILSNFTKILDDNGALYLGVNGENHFSAHLRRVLPSLGINLSELKDIRSAREILKLCDSFQRRKRGDRVAAFPENLLAGDLFGPLILNLTLEEWLKYANEAGLHFKSSFMVYTALRYILENDASKFLWAKSHTEVIRLIDRLAPSTFHRLLFTRKRESSLPWTERKRLGEWRPSFTPLYKISLPKESSLKKTGNKVVLKSFAVETEIILNLTKQEVSMLRFCDGKRTIDEILSRAPASDAQDIIQRLFYPLYLLLIVRMDRHRGRT